MRLLQSDSHCLTGRSPRIGPKLGLIHSGTVPCSPQLHPHEWVLLFRTSADALIDGLALKIGHDPINWA